MSTTITLPHELYEKIRKKASQKGVNIEKYALDILQSQVTEQNDSNKRLSQFQNLAKSLRLKEIKMSNKEAEKLDKELRQTLKYKMPYFRSLEKAMSWSRNYSWGENDSD